MTLDETSLRASGLTDMGGMTKDDDGCCFPYVSNHTNRGRAEKGQRASASSAGRRFKIRGQSEKRTKMRESERGVKAIRERARESERELSCLQTPRGSEQIDSDGWLISQLAAPKTEVCVHAHTCRAALEFI